MKNALKIKQTFNKAKATYDTNNDLQLSVGEHLITLAKTYCRQTDHIIDLGCGTGATTKNLTSHFSFKTLHAIDIADDLLQKAKEALKNPYIPTNKESRIPAKTMFPNVVARSVFCDEAIQLIADGVLDCFVAKNAPRNDDSNNGSDDGSDGYSNDVRELGKKAVKAGIHSPEIHIYEADFNHAFSTNTTFDLIFSNMALHWSLDFNKTLASILNLMHKDSILVFSLPLSGTLHQLKHKFSLNHFFTSNNLLTLLKSHHLQILYQEETAHTLSFTNLLSALKSIKKVGASYTGKQTFQGLGKKNIINTTLPQNLTYVIGYFIVGLPYAN